MYKIAILGTENSHAKAFARLINLPGKDGKKLFPDMEVVGVYGDETSAGEILREANVPYDSKFPDEFLGKVDAVMVTARRGSQHVLYAKPYAEAGIPLFIDKPFTSDYAEAAEFVSLLKSNKVLVSGGSGVKYAPALQDIKKLYEKTSACGEFITATMNFNIMPDSEYDKIFFYASHLIEMALEVFGEDVQAVSALRNRDLITVVFRYEKFDITLLFTGTAQKYSGTLYCSKEIAHFPIDISDIYMREVNVFRNMLVSGEMPQSYESLILPVRLIEVIDESYKTGKTIIL